MRLLLTDTPNDKLTFYIVPNPENPPPYAILSHTWIEGQEVSFQDVQSMVPPSVSRVGTILRRIRPARESVEDKPKDPLIYAKSGYRKIFRCCQQAKQAGYNYVWIDTCCIDRTSDAELSEAINSMYKWYGKAGECIVYLEDLLSPSLEDAMAEGSEFRRCRWFTRGWTLQELIAPRRVNFYTAKWKRVGDKYTLAETIDSITGVHHAILRSQMRIESVSVATKMSWASQRKTSRVEDVAYSIMGLFGVNMPTLYGEGVRAFARLQNELIALSPGHSIFAWNISDDLQHARVLADSPDQFSKSVDIIDIPPHVFSRTWGLQDGVAEPHRTPRGIRLTLPIFKMPETYAAPDWRIDAIAVIACTLLDSAQARRYFLGLALRYAGTGAVSNTYVRAYPNCFIRVQCLLDMGMSWTAQPLILVDRIDKVFDREVLTPTMAEIRIEAHTLRGLCNKLGLVPTQFARLPDSMNPSRNWFTRPDLFEGCNDLTSSSTKDITIKWDGQSKGHLLFNHSNPSSNSNKPSSQILQVTAFPVPYMGLNVSCLHEGVEWNTSADFISVKSTINLHLNKYEDDRKRLKCECGLVADITLVPLKSSSHTEIPRYILEIEVRGDVLTQPSACDARQPQKESRECMEPRLRWVESTAGLIPPNAIPWADNRKCIARIPLQYIGSGLDSRLDSQFRLANGSCVLMEIGDTAMSSAYFLRSYAHVEGHEYIRSVAYEVLVGPTELVFWVSCEGKLKRDALGGATPIDAGCDADGTKLHCARYRRVDEFSDEMCAAIVRVGSLPLDRNSYFEVRPLRDTPYEVLCMRVEKTSSLDIVPSSSTGTYPDSLVLWQEPTKL